MSQPITREALAQAHFRKGIAAAAEADRRPGEVTRLTRSSKANRYPGTCVSCKQEVRPGEGTAERRGTAWVVQHTQCPMVTVTSLPKIESKTGQVYTGILVPGVYTLEDNRGGHATYRVRVQATDADFAPGETIIEFLSGPDNSSDYTAFAFVRGASLVVWRKFREDGYRYLVGGAQALLRDPSRAKVARNCIRCNALLTVPESIEAGIGPTCASRGW